MCTRSLWEKTGYYNNIKQAFLALLHFIIYNNCLEGVLDHLSAKDLSEIPSRFLPILHNLSSLPCVQSETRIACLQSMQTSLFPPFNESIIFGRRAIIWILEERKSFNLFPHSHACRPDFRNFLQFLLPFCDGIL